MKDKFFIPNLMHYLKSFIKGCHVCQLSRSDKPPTRQLQSQIYLNYRHYKTKYGFESDA